MLKVMYEVENQLDKEFKEAWLKRNKNNVDEKFS